MKLRQNNAKFKFSSCTVIVFAALFFWVTFILLHHFRLYESNEASGLPQNRNERLIPTLEDILSQTKKTLSRETDLLNQVLQNNQILDSNYEQDKNFVSQDGKVAQEELGLAEALSPDNLTNQAKREDIEGSAPHREGNDLLHLVFSTDCTFFQDWQAILLFHSAIRVKQEGRVTRIVSGCLDHQKDELETLYETLFPKEYRVTFFLHFTPDFKKDPKTGKSYDFYNKPHGVYHWLRFASPPLIDDEIVILIDPDMILLRPFTYELQKLNREQVFHNEIKVPLYKEDNRLDYSPYVSKPASLRGKVSNITDNYGIPYHYQRGIPVSQVYGIGTSWADETNRNFKKTKICGSGSPCTKVSESFGDKFLSVGPPYIVEKNDLLRLSKTWTEFVPRVYEGYPFLLAEMYAYSMAAAHEELPHVSIKNFMISDIDSGAEGWDMIDPMGDDNCSLDPPNSLFFPDKDMPIVLHYCQFYRIGDVGFHKRRFRKSLLNCEYPLFLEVDPSIVKLDYKNRDGEKVYLTRRQSRRHTFMLCILHRALNDMLTYYKERMCEPQLINQSKIANLVNSSFLH